MAFDRPVELVPGATLEVVRAKTLAPFIEALKA
jgi:hypothetical protein